jgi:hypothetical protein
MLACWKTALNARNAAATAPASGLKPSTGKNTRLLHVVKSAVSSGCR